MHDGVNAIERRVPIGLGIDLAYGCLLARDVDSFASDGGAHRVTLLEERRAQVSTDETRRAGDEHTPHLATLPSSQR
jgi:hypothetical protein